MSVRIKVSYKNVDVKEQFPFNKKLDKKIAMAMKTIGAESYGSGSGFGERDLVFKLELEEKDAVRW